MVRNNTATSHASDSGGAGFDSSLGSSLSWLLF